MKNSPLEFKKKLLQYFIENTIGYANQHIKERREELNRAPASEIETRCFRLTKWTSYVEFQNHTLLELQGEKLDGFLG